MMKFYGVLVLTIIIAIGCFVFWTNSQNKLQGTSENEIWEAEYKNEKIGGSSIGWKVSVQQLNKEELTVKKLLFLEDDKKIFEQLKFQNGIDIDGTKYSLHPFSYPNLYFGDAPKDNVDYTIEIVWVDQSGNEHTDKIELK
ncbi:hypothetical protein ACH0B5_17180 [Ureibacillus sp. 179-F W5.1 NHS]|uniref:Lipoprotein n=1 Tax=Lysinibacillus halotolerans TaxID=1368476 RepID=A0A3M8H1H8_9BACI|nr:hypothetical protein [Lysinibacillus halotolerans]RNC96292.1 hypothetical protein EC501_16950 [Lysinibacillus halotolerans]